jgi:hypothetical protein
MPSHETASCPVVSWTQLLRRLERRTSRRRSNVCAAGAAPRGHPGAFRILCITVGFLVSKWLPFEPSSSVPRRLRPASEQPWGMVRTHHDEPDEDPADYESEGRPFESAQALAATAELPCSAVPRELVPDSDPNPWKTVAPREALPLADARSHGPYPPTHAALSAPLASTTKRCAAGGRRCEAGDQRALGRYAGRCR